MSEGAVERAPKPSRYQIHGFIQPPSLLVCVFKALFHTVSAQEMMHGEEELAPRTWHVKTSLLCMSFLSNSF